MKASLLGRITSIFQKYRTILICSFVLVLLNVGIDFTFHYATDTYSTANEKGTWYHILYENGRPLKSLIFYIFEAFNVPIGIIYHISHSLMIVFATIAVVLFAVMLLRYISSELVCVLISFVTLLNPFVIDFFLFEEKGLFMMIVLLNVVAIVITEGMWTGTVKGHLGANVLLIQLCLWVTVSIYQVGVMQYVVMLLPFIVINSKDFKDFFSKNVFVSFMFGIPLSASFVLAKFFLPVTRLANDTSLSFLVSNFLKIFKFVTLGKFYNVGKGMFLLWLGILTVADILSIVACSEIGKYVLGGLMQLLSVIYISVGCIVVSFLLFITGNSTVCWPRMVYSYGMIFGIVSIYLWYCVERKGARGSIAVKMIIITLVVFIIIYDYIGFGKVILERHRANQEDMYYAEIIGQRITEYEGDTGYTIDTICYYKDFNVTVYGKGYDNSMLSERAQASGWSRHNSIEIYLDRKFTQGEPDPELEEKFSQEDWNMFSEKQLVFDGNTLHICVY